MPITLELSPDIEMDLRSEATRRNVGVEAFASEYFSRSWRGHRRKRSPLDILTTDEKQTIADLNAELSRDFWLRHNALQEKIRERTITPEEHEELSAMLDRSGEWNIRRIEAIRIMAQRRGMRWTDLMRRLKITHHPDANAGRTEVLS